MSEETIHISSAVISTRPELGPALAAQIAAIPDTEVHAAKDGKIVVVMEGPSAGALGERLAALAALPGVLCANMVFEQADAPELADAPEPTESPA